jgi:hypothetical protein
MKGHIAVSIENHVNVGRFEVNVAWRREFLLLFAAPETKSSG